MTTYNESQTFCEIENFIQAILANQISVEQFKQQIIPLIKKSRRFFVDGNNYIAAIIVFKYLEQIIFKANAFKFYDSIQDLPDHVVEGFIKYVHDQAGLIEADYQADQKQHKAEVKKAERFLLESMQQQDHLTIFPVYLGIQPEALSVVRLYDLDLYLSTFLKLIRSRDTELFVQFIPWYGRLNMIQNKAIMFSYSVSMLDRHKIRPCCSALTAAHGA